MPPLKRRTHATQNIWPPNRAGTSRAGRVRVACLGLLHAWSHDQDTTNAVRRCDLVCSPCPARSLPWTHHRKGIDHEATTHPTRASDHDLVRRSQPRVHVLCGLYRLDPQIVPGARRQLPRRQRRADAISAPDYARWNGLLGRNPRSPVKERLEPGPHAFSEVCISLL